MRYDTVEQQLENFLDDFVFGQGDAQELISDGDGTEKGVLVAVSKTSIKVSREV